MIESTTWPDVAIVLCQAISVVGVFWAVVWAAAQGEKSRVAILAIAKTDEIEALKRRINELEEFIEAEGACRQVAGHS